jgi:hypothetical protein
VAVEDKGNPVLCRRFDGWDFYLESKFSTSSIM